MFSKIPFSLTETLCVGVSEEISVKISVFKPKSNITKDRDYLRERLKGLVILCSKEGLLFETKFIKKLPSMNEEHNSYRLDEDIVEELLGSYKVAYDDEGLYLESYVAIMMKVTNSFGVSEEKIDFKVFSYFF